MDEEISTHEQLRNKGVWAVGGGKLILTEKKMGIRRGINQGNKPEALLCYDVV